MKILKISKVVVEFFPGFLSGYRCARQADLDRQALLDPIGALLILERRPIVKSVRNWEKNNYPILSAPGESIVGRPVGRPYGYLEFWVFYFFLVPNLLWRQYEGCQINRNFRR
jgi:hypothetical protein